MATFGKTDIGGSSATDYDWFSYWACKFTITENGELSKITVYGNNPTGTCNYTCAIYADSGGAPAGRLGLSNAISIGTTPDWYEFTFSPTISLTGSTPYWLCIGSQAGGWKWYYASGATNQHAKKLGDTYPPPDPFGASPTYSAREMSIYGTYTPAVVAKVPLKYTPHAAI